MKPKQEPAAPRSNDAVSTHGGIHHILDALPSLVSVADHQGYYRYCNKATEEWFGWPKEKIISRHYRELLGDECSDLIEPFARRAFAGEAIRFEIREPHRDGSLRDVIADYIPYFAGDGSVEGLYVVITDVTEIKKAEEQLREINNLLEEKVTERTEEILELSSNVPAFFYYVDTEGRYLFANRRYASFYHLTPEQLIGKTIREVIGEEKYKIAGPNFERALRGSETVFTNVVRDPGSPDRYFRARYSPRRNRDGEIIGAFLLATDITLEHELERAALVAADRERETVARELHDGICQELTAISFLARSIERRLLSSGNPEAESLTELGNLIRETLEKTRTVAHGLSIAPQGMLDLKSSLLLFLKSMSHHASCDMKVRFTLDESVLCPDVRGQLYLVFREAVTNALKHGHPTRLIVRVFRHEGRVRLIVADNGRENPSLPQDGQGMGLRAMDYRARLLGGSTGISARRRKPGVIVSCEIPLP